MNGDFTLSNKTNFIIKSGGYVEINGNVVANNQGNIQVDGDFFINGSYTGKNKTSVQGTGTFTSTEGMNTEGGNSSVFGENPYTCTSNCSGSSECSESLVNTLGTVSQSICTFPFVIDGDPLSGAFEEIWWESSTSSATAGFTRIDGSNTEDYTVNALSATTWYRRKVKISDNCASVSEAVQLSNSATILWTGTEDSNWSNENNWCGGVPTSGSNVTIGVGPNDPVVDVNASVNDLTIESGSSVSFSGGNNLNVHGNWVNNGGSIDPNDGTVTFSGSNHSVLGENTFNNLSINNGSLTITGGSLLVKGKISLSNGTIVTNNNLTLDLTDGGMIAGPSVASGSDGIVGDIRIKRAVSAVSANTFHYLSSPLGSGTIADFEDDQSYIVGGYASYYYYDETVRSSDKNVGFKPHRSTSGTFGGAELKGLGLYQRSTLVTFDITGSYDHYASYNNVALSHTKYTLGGVDPEISTDADGWQLIGNPYPSPIDWDVIYSQSNNIEGSFYVYNNATGTYGVYGGGESMINISSKYLEPMQAFFVKTIDQGAYISINHESRSTSGSGSFYRIEKPSFIKFIVEKGSLKDESIIRFKEDGTYFHDPQYDAVKFMNGGNNPSLYTKFGETSYSINTLPLSIEEDIDVPLHLSIAESGNYELRVSEIETLDPSLSVYLRDKETGRVYDLRNEGTVSFEANKEDAPGRFVIEFRLPKITSAQSSLSQTVRFVAYTDKIKAEFLNTGTERADIMVSDLMGNQVVAARNVNVSNGQYLIPVNSGGIYVIKVKVGHTVVTEKIYIPGN